MAPLARHRANADSQRLNTIPDVGFPAASVTIGDLAPLSS